MTAAVMSKRKYQKKTSRKVPNVLDVNMGGWIKAAVLIFCGHQKK
jgi:hypothetical protein